MAKKPKQHSSCTRVRHMKITHMMMTLSLCAQDVQTRDDSERVEWVTRECGTPLFGDEERKAGVCRSCASGWTHPENYPVDELAKTA